MTTRNPFRWRLSALTMGCCAAIFSLEGVTAKNATDAFYDGYRTALATYVDDQGMVNYRGLKAHPEALNAFLAQLEALDRATYDQWEAKQRIALWINAYNALTLKAIIDHYPIKPSWKASLLHPKNSIRQISGVWDKLKFRVMGREMTLENIEHDTLRKMFDEPRIHMALVCAAMGCPPLRNEPYTGDELDAQLDDQTRRFLGTPEKLRVDRDRGHIHLSSIFKWFGEDFIPSYGTDDMFSGYSTAQRAVLYFIHGYLHAQDREYLMTGEYSIKYFDYDWSLNEQAE